MGRGEAGHLAKSYFLPMFRLSFLFLAYFSPIFGISVFLYSVAGQREFCCAESWESWAEVVAEVFFLL